METLFRVELSTACFGIITEYREDINQEVVTYGAPISKKLWGQDINIVKSWVENKNGKFEKIKTFSKNENKNKKLF